MSRTSGGRNINFLYDPPNTVNIEYLNCDIVTRFNPTPIIKRSPFKNLTWFTGTTINDVFQSKPLGFNESGLYDMEIECETGPLSGYIVFYLDQNIIGAVDFYSMFPNFTIKYVEGIQIIAPNKYTLSGKVDTKNNDSLGFNIAMANIRLIKRF
jgi:hypothetical protein